ncbi:alpha/beta hydrolase [Salmonella enterica]|nr:alpha/beta hydrolase [Salmonella enterica subsp. enterica serovar Muenchen]EEB8179778.1 alpha/beta fold hydrolase [Salmonella enterica]EDL2899358.1 alpha/beta hydrolase [Salmonella enterica subsp. enterica serovar Muenchen]EFR4755021.1 alpha/beta hydrolase [Salmonella enterica]EFR4768355.1 alpha/beta hydrolase [Salmonella enterica]
MMLFLFNLNNMVFYTESDWRGVMNHIFKFAFIFIINIIFLINASATTMDKDKFVEANGIKIHYVEEGEGPPLLLIHGGGLTAKSWQGLAKEASRYFRVIMPDSRGHGLTNNPQGTFSYDLMTEDMAAFVKALKLEKPLVMGYSDGGMVVLKLTSRYPDLARAAIVGGATHRFATTHYMQGMEIFYGKGMPPGQLTDRDLDKMASDAPGMVKFYQNMHHPEQKDYWRTFLKGVWPMWTTPTSLTEEEVKKIHIPVLLLDGDRDEFFTVEEVTELYRLLPQAEMTLIPGSGHAIFQTPGKTPLFYALVLEFLQRQIPKTS